MSRFQHADVEGLRVGRFAGRLNTTCVLYRLGDAIIDTGPANQWSVVRGFIEERDIAKVIVTHHHEDHSGNLASIGDATGARAYAPVASRRRLAHGFVLRPYQHIVWGRPRSAKTSVLPEALELAGGFRLVPISAPGHSSDMTCYLEPERGWLFSGDLYVSSKTIYLRQDEDLRLHLQSLRDILQLQFETVFCSHRGVLNSGRSAIQRKLEFLENLREEVGRLRDQGIGVPEITRRLLGREDMMTLITGFHYSKKNLIRACNAIIAPRVEH